VEEDIAELEAISDPEFGEKVRKALENKEFDPSDYRQHQADGQH